MNSAADPEPGPDPGQRLLRLLGGKWIAAAVSTAAKLRLAEALAIEPADVETLAAKLSCDVQSLARLLRVLHAEELLEIDRERRFSLTPMGTLLSQGEMGSLAEFIGAPFAWNPWSELDTTIRTGTSAFEEHHGESLFDYLDHHEAEAQLYHRAVDSFTRRQARALGDAFDFSDVTCVADVGGGRGTLLVELLRRWSHLRGILLERPAVVAQARAGFLAAGFEDRCRAVAGDFFEAIPTEADVCVVKHVIHNWDDDRASELLTRCREAVGATGSVLIVEGLVLPGGRQDLTRLMDLEMLALCGPGHERTKPEMRRLLHRAGLRLERTSDLAQMTRLLVCSPG